MKRTDLIVIGAGPAGLSAAIEAAKAGLEVLVFDENAKPGGQLFKQIHKFFCSKAHRAKMRGFKIGEALLQEAEALAVKVVLNATVMGIYQEREVVVMMGDAIEHYKGDAIIVATGASENMVPFEGWTLPGVIGAGAAQTMMNLHGVKPGNKVLMLGSGNVGLVVSFQLMQAGCEVVGLVDGAKHMGGYGVHAAKISRCGVPFYLSHTILRAEGEAGVERVIIGEVDKNWQVIPGSEKTMEADTVCMAVGLSPMSQLLNMARCAMVDDPKRGGVVPLINAYGETSVPGVFAAGDVSGIEEASSAMIEGKIAGIAASYQAGYLEKKQFEAMVNESEQALESLRQGMFGPKNKGKNVIKTTDEGIALSYSLLENGYVGEDEIERFPGVTTQTKGIHPVIECTQNIPCNPCQDACQCHCIRVGNNITALPFIDPQAKCVCCGLCVAYCSGQAIFLVEENEAAGSAQITLPYEFLPLPKVADTGFALNRQGQKVCEAKVVKVKSHESMDATHLLTMEVPLNMVMKARFFKQKETRNG